MININARKRAIGIITGGRVDALEGAGLVVVERAEVEALEAENERLRERFKAPIVCLCGSTRFYRAFDDLNFWFTIQGYIVLSIGCNAKSDEGLNLTTEDKVSLGDLHKRKIDLCGSVFVLDVGGYIGDSTRSEIEYAEKIGRHVRYLSKDIPEYVESVDPVQALRAENERLKEAEKQRLIDPCGHCACTEICEDRKALEVRE